MRLSEVLAMLKGKKYTGAVLLHFQSGIPKLMEIPKVRLTIREPYDLDRTPTVGS
jgi:hypothetical protein